MSSKQKNKYFQKYFEKLKTKSRKKKYQNARIELTMFFLWLVGL